jgi:hypothetical protein
MSNLKLKAEFTNKILERKSAKSGARIKIDTSKLDPNKYQAYYDIGFSDIFETTSKKVSVEVDSLSDLTYAELKEQAIAKGLEFAKNIKKVDLIELLNGKA